MDEKPQRLDPAEAAKPARTDAKYRPSGGDGLANKRSASTGGDAKTLGDRRGVRKLILCFDGTGNKFHGDDSDSNILKIFRMLDRTADDQYHYYQPGIGTYVVSGSLSHTSVRARINSWYTKAKDSAIGSSFDQHVVGGYRFLMRFYNPGDEIYMFGFSRGSYIARFLAEMLDYIGLLSHGNEEMVKFAWKAFAQWQCRQQPGGSDEDVAEAEKQKREMYSFMKGFRETFSRPVGRIRFLGLFDTVNSVPRFETAWMQRSKFPYTARSSAKVIRHGVSIDERRAKFRQDLMYQGNPATKHHHHHHLGEVFDYFHHAEEALKAELPSESQPTAERGRRPSQLLAPESRNGGGGGAASRKKLVSSGGGYAPYRARSKSRQRGPSAGQDGDNESTLSSGIPPSELDPDWDEDGQDIDEVWFAGGHGDVGGGWEALSDRKSASHIPLTWMVREAMKAGLPFDADKVREMGCSTVFRSQGKGKVDGANEPRGDIDIPDILVANGNGTPVVASGPPSPELTMKSGEHGGRLDEEHGPEFHKMMHRAHTARIHDSLSYDSGLGLMAVSAWKFMEWLPFRRMDLRKDGSWAPIRWPLPRGETRDVPTNVRVHGSVIRRMEQDPGYRPGNLIVGGGGRGVRMAPDEYGMGDWVCVAEPGDPIGEIWTRKGNSGGDKQQ